MMLLSHGFCVASYYSIHKSRCGKRTSALVALPLFRVDTIRQILWSNFFCPCRVDNLNFMRILEVADGFPLGEND